MTTATSRVLEYIKTTSGVLPSHVAAALPDVSSSTVYSAIENLYQSGQLQRNETPSGGYVYFADGAQVAISNQQLAALESRAKELEGKCLWRRAASVWLEAYDAARANSDRERYRKRRLRCLAGMTRGHGDGGELAGRYVGNN